MTTSIDRILSSLDPSVKLKVLYESSAAVTQNETCLQLYKDLMQPFGELAHTESALDPGLWKCAPLDELPLSSTANVLSIVNYAYNARYLNDCFDYAEVFSMESLNTPTARTLVVYQSIGNQLIALGTWRVIWGDCLETFEFFEMNSGYQWPHQEDSIIPKQTAEVSRLAFHPILDVGNQASIKMHKLALRMKQHVLRMLWVEGMHCMLAQRVELFYLILIPAVKRFFESCGVQLMAVDRASHTDREETKLIRIRYNNYWRPGAPSSEMPALYTAQWDLLNTLKKGNKYPMDKLLMEIAQRRQMNQTSPPHYRPVLFRLQAQEDCKRLQELLEEQSDIQVRDDIAGQLAELIKSRHPYRKFTEDELKEAVHRHLGEIPLEQYGVWVYYPWLRTLLHLLDEQEFALLRTNRNRYKITDEEQQTLASKKIGIIGLSVGQSIAVTMAMERGFGEIRLGDFDTLELTNLNRIRTGVHNLGVDKVIVTAREIAEIDPFLKVICYTEGVNEENIDRFMLDGGKLDIMVDECDSIDMKILARQRAKAHRIPVVMDTSDRGLLDIERFDLDPARPVLHGLIGNLDYQTLKGLTTEDKVPYILRIIGIDSISKRMKASLVEVEKSINTWPQLASAVVLGGALGADVCRRISLGQHQHSGRYYVDLEQAVPNQAMEVPEHEPNFLLSTREHYKLARPMSLSIGEMTQSIQMCDRVDAGAIHLLKEQVQHLVEQAVMAPSGGNVQPWQWVYEPGRLHLFLDPSRPDTFLDAHHNAAYMSLGSAAENLTLAAHTLGLQVRSRPFPVEVNPGFVCSFEFHDNSWDNEKFAYLAEFIPHRITNRKATGRKRIPAESLDLIRLCAESIHGAKMHLLERAEQLDEIGQIIASAERMRILHPEAHANLVSELRWTDEEATATRDGVDLATLELTTTDWAGIRITSDPSVVALIRDWKGGANLEKVPRKMIASASNAALITMPSNRPIDYFNGGRAVQRAWLEATKQRVAFQPLSVVTYMFSRLFNFEEERFMQPSMVAELKQLRSRYLTLFPIAPGMGEIFLFRLGVEEVPQVRSLRRYVDDVLFFVDS